MWSHSQTKPSLSHASLCIFSQPWTVLLNFPVPILDPRASILKVRLCSFLCLACCVHLVTLWRGVGYDYPLLDTSGTSNALSLTHDSYGISVIFSAQALFPLHRALQCFQSCFPESDLTVQLSCLRCFGQSTYFWGLSTEVSGRKYEALSESSPSPYLLTFVP